MSSVVPYICRNGRSNACIACRMVAGGNGEAPYPNSRIALVFVRRQHAGLQQRVQHGRHQHRVRSTLPFHQQQRALGIPWAHDDGGRGMIQISHHVHDRNAGRRHGVQPAARGVDALAHRDIEDRAQEWLVRIDRTLWQARSIPWCRRSSQCRAASAASSGSSAARRNQPLVFAAGRAEFDDTAWRQAALRRAAAHIRCGRTAPTARSRRSGQRSRARPGAGSGRPGSHRS